MEEIESKYSSQEEIIMLGSTSSEENTTGVEEDITSQEVVEETSECIESSEAGTVEQTEEQNEGEADDKISVIFDNLQELSNKVEQMNQLFVQKIAHTSH